ncbi:sensor histidine kinase [Parafilimonas sp.]|uniref:sensor histidine kinase n=1 Tax=Parafilimonas sp. TaxID=1969739 RepID=UPI0039E65225
MVNKRSLTVIIHVIGCIVFLAIPVFLTPDFPRSLNIFSNRPTQRDLIAYALMVSFFYLNFFVLIPRLYVAKKYFVFFSIGFICFLLISFAPSVLIPQNNRVMEESFRDMPPPPANGSQNSRPPAPRDSSLRGPQGSLRRPSSRNMRRMPPPGELNNYLLGVLHYFFIFIAIVFFSLILTINNRLKQSQKEKLQAELRYLKAQINPHFLFNTLNTIYSLAIERSQATATAVVKLSAMMRYVINDSGKDFVLLEQEVNYINNYIELQRMRFGDSIHLDFKVEGNASGKMIAPIILIPFIENAFKYGVNAEEVSVINIHIYIEESTLQLIVENNKVKIAKPIEERTGLGIANTRNRLGLLYPGKHELVVKDGDIFYISLTLNLE